MKKLLKKLKSNTGWLVAIALVVLAAGSVFAFTGTGSTVIENAENVTVQGNCDLVEGLGAASDYCDGTEGVANMCVVDVYTLTSSGSLSVTGTATFSGSQTTISATSTISRLDAIPQIEMTWASSTYGFPKVNDPTVLVKVQNTGADMICTDVWMDVSTAVTSFGGTYSVGTTTATGDLSLTATTTATLIAATAITTSTAVTLNKQDEEGSNAEEAWIWSNSEYVVASMNTAGGATSTNSISTAGAFAGVGRLHLNCRNRF